MPHPPDPLLVGRYVVGVAACELIPLPVLDTFVENRVRRAMVRAQAHRHGVALDPAVVAALADKEGLGCAGALKAVLWWPIKKLLKALTTVFMVKGIADTAAEVVHRSLMVDEALNHGWLPERAEQVRAAMDDALHHIDTRWDERWLLGTLRRGKGRHNLLVWRVAREGASFGLSAELERAAAAPGISSEVLHWFHLAMAAPSGASAAPTAER